MNSHVILYFILISIIIYMYFNKDDDKSPTPNDVSPTSNDSPTLNHDISDCNEGIVYTLNSSESYDDITHSYRRPLTMTPVSEIREIGDPDYCHDTSITDVCSRYTKTCKDSSGQDEIRTANVITTSGTPLAFACEIEDCRENSDCVDEYNAWSACSTNCGPMGTRKRAKCGQEDNSEYDQIEDCNRDKECKPGCTGTNAFSSWNDCTKSCGGGLKSRYDCATGSVSEESCNIQPCPSGCTGDEIDGYSEWTVDGIVPLAGSYTESRIDCDPSGPQPRVTTRIRFVDGFNSDGIQITSDNNAFILRLNPVLWEDGNIPNGNYTIQVQVNRGSEGSDGWNTIHSFTKTTHQLTSETQIRVPFVDVNSPNNNISEAFTYRVRITYNGGGVELSRTSYEYQIPLTDITPIDCIGGWSECVNGLKVYNVTSAAYFGGSCDYNVNQQALCTDGGTSTSPDVYAECAYYVCLIKFTQAILNDYQLTSDVEYFGVKFGFNLFHGTSAIQFNERAYLRNTSNSFDGNWKLENELVLRAGSPDDTIKLEETGLTGVVYFKLRDRYLHLDTTSEYVFNGQRAFHLKFVPASQKNNHCYFVKQQAVAVVNGQTQTVFTLKTYVGDLAVGFSHFNTQFFAAYEDYKYSLQFQFIRSSNQDNTCSSLIPDGETECVMSEWSEWSACDDTCKRTQTRTRVSGSTEGCPPTIMEESCPDGTELYRQSWIPEECDCENGVYTRYQQSLTCESDGQRMWNWETENCECPDVECQYSGWYETTDCDPSTCLQQISRTVTNLPRDYHTCTEPLDQAYKCCDTYDYTMGTRGTSCGEGNLITTEWQCKNAAQSLGLNVKTKYGDPYTMNMGKYDVYKGPWFTKGCYINHTGAGDYLYFNEHTENPDAYNSQNTPLCTNQPDTSTWTPTIYYGPGKGATSCDSESDIITYPMECRYARAYLHFHQNVDYLAGDVTAGNSSSLPKGCSFNHEGRRIYVNTNNSGTNTSVHVEPMCKRS